MKFLANENLPRKSIRILRQRGFEVASIAEISAGLGDEEVLRIAQKEGRILLTFDKDFGELVFRKGGEARGIILLRFAPRSPEYIAKRIERLLKAEEITFEGQFVVVTESRIRVTPLMKRKRES